MFLIGEEKTVARPFDSTAQWLKSDSCRLGVELEMLHCSSLKTRRIAFLAIIIISDCVGTRSAREGGFGQFYDECSVQEEINQSLLRLAVRL